MRTPSERTSIAPLAALAAAGLGRRDAVAALELLLGVAHRAAYAAALEIAFGDNAVPVSPTRTPTSGTSSAPG